MQWKGKVYVVPLNTNAQLLWYRKDLVPTPPKTWDEMIAMAKKLPASDGLIEEQGKKYEGYSSGSTTSSPRPAAQIVNANGTPTLGKPAVKAAQIIKDVADVGPRRPVAVDRPGGPGAARVRGRQGRVHAQLALRLRRGAHGRQDQPGDQEGLREHGLGAASPASTRASPSRSRSAAPTSASRSTGQNPALADAGRALHDAARKWQDQEAINEGLPPVTNNVLRQPEGRKAYPFADLLREQLKDAVAAPADAAVLGRDAGDPALAASAGGHQPADRRSTRCKTA